MPDCPPPFYRHSVLSAFGAHDHETMAKFCADDETFGDPLFTELDADGVRAMWRMFCTSGNNIEVSFNHVQADDASGSARWETIYVFPKAGRRFTTRSGSRSPSETVSTFATATTSTSTAGPGWLSDRQGHFQAGESAGGCVAVGRLVVG